MYERLSVDSTIASGVKFVGALIAVVMMAATGSGPTRDVKPEEAVAQGAAIHAAILEARQTGGDSRMAKAVTNRLRSVSTTDVNSHSLGIKITDPGNRTRKVNHIMVPKNTSVVESIRLPLVP